MNNPLKKPSWWDEFKTFAIKGNAMALAVGTIIGAAFSTITKSLTAGPAPAVCRSRSGRRWK